MTVKQRVPKSVADLSAIDDLKHVGAVERFSERPHPDGIKGRFVPDDLLKERFAFAGQKVVPADAVVLTREEACRLLKAMKLAFDCVDERKAPQWFLDARHALQSKLKAQEDGK